MAFSKEADFEQALIRHRSRRGSGLPDQHAGEVLRPAGPDRLYQQPLLSIYLMIQTMSSKILAK